MTIRAKLIAGATAFVALSSAALAHDIYVHELNIYTSEDWALLNPQPLPPRDVVLDGLSIGDEVMLNPQPLPPGEAFGGTFDAPGGDVMLNPQPLPPRDGNLEDLAPGF